MHFDELVVGISVSRVPSRNPLVAAVVEPAVAFLSQQFAELP
jgi:hypothetical protein